MKSVLLFYQYAKIENPEKLKADIVRACRAFSIRGRIIVANEGINGTCSGDPDNVERIKEWFHSVPEISDMAFKERIEQEDVFKKLSVKVRPELVTLKQGLNILDEKIKRGTYLEPEEFHNIISSDDEYYIVDVRNTYETYIGKFKGSIALPIDNFRDLPEGIKEIAHLKDKKVITVCTGGIRCEKATAFLIKEGFENVYQLHGGIVTYGKQFQGEGYEGKCYVFDERVSVDMGEKADEAPSICCHCGKKEDRYINCCDATCNKQMVCCIDCEKAFEGGCSEKCAANSRYKNAGQNS